MTVKKILDKNLFSLKKNYPELSKICESKIYEHLLSDFQTSRFENVLIHSERDPVREANKLAENALKEASKEGAVFILGLGFGYAAEAVLQIEKNAVLVIVEKRIDVFLTALQTRDLSALFEGARHAFIIGGQSEGVLAALEVVKNVRAILRNRALISLDVEWFNDVERCIKTWQEKSAINAATLAKFGKLWTRNTTKNLWALRDYPGIKNLAGKFDFPILVVAAGPSLDNIRAVRNEMRERFVIVAVDTALRFLHGVTPDFVLTADPQYWNLRHLDPLFLDGAGACLVAEISVQSAALRLPVRTLLSSPLYPPGPEVEAKVDVKGRLGAGGSVATSALDFALNIRRSGGGNTAGRSDGKADGKAPPVFIAGLDLAFPDFRTHYKGALFEELILSTQTRIATTQTAVWRALHSAAPFWTAAVGGGKVLTDKRLSLYARWFENRVKNMDATDVFSLAAGAEVRGIAATSLEAALALPARRAEIDARKKELFEAVDAAWQNDAPARSEKFRLSTQGLAQSCLQSF